MILRIDHRLSTTPAAIAGACPPRVSCLRAKLQTQSGTQIRRLRRETVRWLRRLLEQHDQAEVFAGLHRTTLYHHLNQILLAAGIPADRRHKFHCMRRSHASWLHRAGGDATASLGHSDPAITRKFYLDRRITDRWQAIDWLFSPLSWWDRVLSVLGR